MTLIFLIKLNNYYLVLSQQSQISKLIIKKNLKINYKIKRNKLKK
jgi:hypothetical protein